MTDEDSIPGAPRTPTIPAAKDDDPVRLMRELRGALENVCELATRLDTRLAQVMLAELASEHQINALRERSDTTAKRLKAVEDRLGMAAE